MLIMKASTSPMTVKLAEYMNPREFAGCNLNPVVVLTDCRKSLKKTTPPPETPPSLPGNPDFVKIRTEVDSREGPRGPAKLKIIKNDVTPPRSSPELSLQKSKSVKRKREPCETHVEYEVEKIVGYHRDKQKKMWYFIKWKGWSEEYNTFEPIDNLTRCHYELMKYFEGNLVSTQNVQEKDSQLLEAVMKTDIYRKLRRNECTSDDLKVFSRKFPPNWGRLFGTKNLDRLEEQIQEQYGYIVRCLVAMDLHQDTGLILRGQNYKLLLMLIQQRRKQLQNLAAAEKMINDRESTEIRIVNDVDLDEFPVLNYIVEMKSGEGVPYQKDPLLGCECGECKPKSQCCGKMSDSIFAYSPNGTLRTSTRVAIYECNSRCRCPPTCHNRVVQHGRQVKLCIFKTKSCGWGVKALEVIPKGTFVCEYIGELIPDSEANVRDVVYFRERRSGYMFDLDFFTHKALDMYCIDATKYGNVARFINHSCDPNLVVYPVWVDELAPNMHRLAFFARRRIREGEEIHFDYENLDDSSVEDPEDNGVGYAMRMVSNVRCHCNSFNCRNWVFGNK